MVWKLVITAGSPMFVSKVMVFFVRSSIITP